MASIVDHAVLKIVQDIVNNLPADFVTRQEPGHISKLLECLLTTPAQRPLKGFDFVIVGEGPIPHLSLVRFLSGCGGTVFETWEMIHVSKATIKSLKPIVFVIGKHHYGLSMRFRDKSQTVRPRWPNDWNCKVHLHRTKGWALSATFEPDHATGCDHASLLRWVMAGFPPLPTGSKPSDYFRWPNTVAEPSWQNSSRSFSEFRDVGPLSAMGYRVGQTGASAPIRLGVLTNAFKSEDLPPLDESACPEDWGTAQSATRLRKIAESIAAFCRDAKRRQTAAMGQAISDWESDLQWLKANFYDGRFDGTFAWPTLPSAKIVEDRTEL